MGHVSRINLNSLAQRALIVAALFTALGSRTFATQGPAPANLPQPQLDSSSVPGPSSGQLPQGNSQQMKPEATLDDLAEILRYGVSNITAQAARMQSDVANATASWFRNLVGSTGSDNTRGQIEPFSAVTLDSAQRCAACPPETQLVCCRRRATYVNACKAAACSGELPTSCTPGACKAPEDLVQTGGLVSVLGLPALMPAVREPMGSGSVSGRGNGSAAVAVTKTPAEPVTAVQAFDGRHDSSELPVDVWVAKQPQRGGADRAPGDENGTPPAGAGQGASHLGPATAQPQQQTVTEPALMQLFAAAATPAPASAVPIVPQVLSPTVPAMASEMAPALRQALAFQLTQTASSLPTVQEPSKTTSPGAIAAPASTSIRPLAVSVPAAGASTPATEFRPPTPASQAAPPVSMPEGLGTGKAAVPITVQAPLPTPGPPTAAAVAAPTAVAAAMAVAASTAATADLTTAPSTGGVFAPQQHPDPPFWMPQSCDCPLDWEPICCGGRTFMNRCTAVCVGGVVDTGHCSPVLSGEQCVPTAADATEPALQHGEPQAAVSAPKEMQQPQQAAVQGLQTAQHVNQAQPTAQGHLAAGLTANKLSLVRQPPQQAP